MIQNDEPRGADLRELYPTLLSYFIHIICESYQYPQLIFAALHFCFHKEEIRKQIATDTNSLTFVEVFLALTQSPDDSQQSFVEKVLEEAREYFDSLNSDDLDENREADNDNEQKLPDDTDRKIAAFLHALELYASDFDRDEDATVLRERIEQFVRTTLSVFTGESLKKLTDIVLVLDKENEFRELQLPINVPQLSSIFESVLNSSLPYLGDTALEPPTIEVSAGGNDIELNLLFQEEVEKA